MDRTWTGGGRGRRAVVLGLSVLSALCLTGCTIATPAASGSSAAVSPVQLAAPAVGASIVVTVPDLGVVASAPDGSSAASAPVVSKPAAGSVSVPSSVPGESISKPAVPSISSTAAAVAPPATPAQPTNPPAPVTPTVPAKSTPTTSAAAATGNAAATGAAAATGNAAPPTAVSTLNVTLANCAGCTVLATHAAVTSTMGAALVATGQGHAALLSLRGDGSVAGAANVTYGTSFPTPPDGQLGCDGSGRCIVIAKQDDGTAVAAAYQVSASGTWADVTGPAGMASVTAVARTLTVGGGIGVAVQDQADGSTVWIVYGWDGSGYAVKGCTAAATPDANALSMTSCLS